MPRIVIISHRNKNPLNYRINAGFYNKLSDVCDCTMVDAYDKSTGIIYEPEYIMERYNPDVVICHAHHPYLQGYMRKFNKCLRVMIAVDSWKMVRDNNPSFYIDNDFHLIVYRSSYDVEFHKKTGTEGVWLPFSASEKEFYPGKNKRTNIVGFAGTVAPSYSQRIKAISILQKNSLLDFKGVISGGEYAKYLRSITVALTSADKGCVHGKTFEMMASGTVVLSPVIDSDKLLFGDNASYVRVKRDCSDIVEKAQYILNDKEAQKEISNNAYKQFLSKHTDDIRIRELYCHINNMIRGFPIEKIWNK
jgi:hypothetical protein